MKQSFILSTSLTLLFSSILSAQMFLPFGQLFPTEAPVPPPPPPPIYMEEAPLPVGPTTSIEFVETNFDFGTAEEGVKVRHEYLFTNTGAEPLVISNAKASCGCTVPEWPKDPVPPGGSATILVEFDTKSKLGKQNKRVTITANTAPAQTFISMSGEVKEGPEAINSETEPIAEESDTDADWQKILPAEGDALEPFLLLPEPSEEEETTQEAPQNAAITFDETVFDFGTIQQGEKVQHIFRFVNTGQEPLLLSSARGSCGCTVPSWPMEPIPPGGSGAIVVEFDSKGKMGLQSKMVTVTANTDPAQIFLNVKGEIFMPDEEQKTAPIKPGITEGSQASILQSAKPSGLRVYPNPATETLWLELENAAGKPISVEIFNANGQWMGQMEVEEAGSEPVKVDIVGLVGGTYWLSVQVGDGKRSSVPFVVKKD